MRNEIPVGLRSNRHRRGRFHRRGLDGHRGGSFGFFIGPLVIWLMKKDTMPFVNDQGKEALNFAITVSIACVALLVLTILSLGIGALLTIPLLMAIGIASLVFVIMAAIKANEGVAYRYPVSIRLVK